MSNKLDFYIYNTLNNNIDKTIRNVKIRARGHLGSNVKNAILSFELHDYKIVNSKENIKNSMVNLLIDKETFSYEELGNNYVKNFYLELKKKVVLDNNLKIKISLIDGSNDNYKNKVLVSYDYFSYLIESGLFLELMGEEYYKNIKMSSYFIILTNSNQFIDFYDLFSINKLLKGVKDIEANYKGLDINSYKNALIYYLHKNLDEINKESSDDNFKFYKKEKIFVENSMIVDKKDLNDKLYEKIKSYIFKDVLDKSLLDDGSLDLVISKKLYKNLKI